ncbi:hypothetical protein MYE70_00645 [Marinobacter alexandrii]|uniref:hypothetical protein n=1 Tax=Marinobacter alexandrii TaxID=2570351 RepID=UPI001FFE5B1A|nr:hypothetical protein [Marinobacter alexandrii]MCK2147565.1 hypothetical protein [Marinobacter alexandrii]
MFHRIALTFVAIVFVSGCKTTPDVAELDVDDRITECSAGYSQTLKASLKAKLDESLKSGSAEATAVKQSSAAIFEHLDQNDRLEAYKNYLTCMQVEPNPKVVEELSQGELRTQASQLQFAKNVCLGEDVDFSIAQTALQGEVSAQDSVSMQSVAYGMAGQITFPITESEQIYNAYVNCLTTVFRSLG